jgi:DNA end-binding protein Ku
MAARALASVTVTFGMVSIPVKLYTATQAQAGVSFNLLHAACGSRLKQ